MPSTPAAERSVDRRATPPLPPSVLVVAMLCATVLVLGFLTAAVWMIYTGRDLAILLDAVSGPTGLVAIVGQIATLIVVLRVKAQGGRTEALTGRVLPELVRERTAPLEHATHVTPVVVPAPEPGVTTVAATPPPTTSTQASGHVAPSRVRDFTHLPDFDHVITGERAATDGVPEPTPWDEDLTVVRDAQGVPVQ